MKKVQPTAKQQELSLFWTSFIPFGTVMLFLALLPLMT